MKSHTDVLIVGAGPTGLTLAALLDKQGINFRIVEKNSKPSPQSRALIVHARSLELLDKLEIAWKAVAQGELARQLHIVVDGKAVAELDIQKLSKELTPFPFLLVLEQSRTEALLRAQFEKEGRGVEWGTELLSLAQGQQEVYAVVRRSDGTEEEITAQWLVGADGARSTVRELLALPFKGEMYERRFFLMDAAVDGALKEGTFYLLLSDKGISGCFPMKGKNRYRIFGAVPEGLSLPNRELRTEEITRVIRDNTALDLQLYDISWTATYRLHHRSVEHFRLGRCFLAGDAAHIHSPVGGQGMNTGIQDAWNLGWKLALVLRQQANMHLLQSYQQERYPVAQAVLGSTDVVFSLMISKKWWAGLLRKQLFPALARLGSRFDWLRSLLFSHLAQLHFHYRKSSINAAYEPGKLFSKQAPRPGDRAPYAMIKDQSGQEQNLFALLRGLQHHLLFIAGKKEAGLTQYEAIKKLISERYSTLIQLHYLSQDSAENRAMARRYGIEEPGFFLIRPDGYIAYRSQPADAGQLEAYLSRLFV